MWVDCEDNTVYWTLQMINVILNRYLSHTLKSVSWYFVKITMIVDIII